jgi:thiamine transporter ThiT
LFELEAEYTPQTMAGIFEWVESLLGGSIPDLRQQRQIAAAVLMTMALIQFRRGQVFGPATGYLWNMLDLFYFRQPEVVADAEA